MATSLGVGRRGTKEYLSENGTSQSNLLQYAQYIIFHSVLQTVGGTFQIWIATSQPTTSINGLEWDNALTQGPCIISSYYIAQVH